MNEIWANRLIAGTKTWDQVPAHRLVAIDAILCYRVAQGEISAERYAEITGEVYE